MHTQYVSDKEHPTTANLLFCNPSINYDNHLPTFLACFSIVRMNLYLANGSSHLIFIISTVTCQCVHLVFYQLDITASIIMCNLHVKGKVSFRAFHDITPENKTFSHVSSSIP